MQDKENQIYRGEMLIHIFKKTKGPECNILWPLVVKRDIADELTPVYF